MKTGRSLQELAIELERQTEVKQDFRVDTSQMKMTEGDITFADYRFPVNDIASRQLAAHTGIPAAYYDRMRQEVPELLDQNVNTWLERSNSRRLIRTLDGGARAFLSSSYRIIDHYEIAETVLPVIREMNDARILSCEVTEQRMYIKVVNPRIETEVAVGDAVQAGVVISNSEVGLGMVSVRPLIFRLVCSNGMISDVGGQKRRHVGKQSTEIEADYEILRDETIAQDNKAFLMKVEDTVRTAVDEAKFSMIVDRMRQAKDAKLTSKNLSGVVEVVAKKLSITESEKQGILTQFIREGDASLYGLGNAFTRHSQDVENYDRATEFETMGWNVMTMAPTLYSQLNQVS